LYLADLYIYSELFFRIWEIRSWPPISGLSNSGINRNHFKSVHLIKWFFEFIGMTIRWDGILRSMVELICSMCPLITYGDQILFCTTSEQYFIVNFVGFGRKFRSKHKLIFNDHKNSCYWNWNCFWVREELLA